MKKKQHARQKGKGPKLQCQHPMHPERLWQQPLHTEVPHNLYVNRGFSEVQNQNVQLCYNLCVFHVILGMLVQAPQISIRACMYPSELLHQSMLWRARLKLSLTLVWKPNTNTKVALVSRTMIASNAVWFRVYLQKDIDQLCFCSNKLVPEWKVCFIMYPLADLLCSLNFSLISGSIAW